MQKSWKICWKTSEHGPKMVPKPLQNRSWRGSGSHLGATLEARCFQDLIFNDFGSILGPCSSVFLTSFWWCLHAFFGSVLQTSTFKITRSHQKKQAERVWETASRFVPSCINKLTSERQWAFQSLLVQVETGRMSTVATGRRPASTLYICHVSAADICPVSTCTSKDRKAH